jgi:hypothetical protein
MTEETTEETTRGTTEKTTQETGEGNCREKFSHHRLEARKEQERSKNSIESQKIAKDRSTGVTASNGERYLVAACQWVWQFPTPVRMFQP